MSDEENDPNVREVFIDRGNSGFGFNIKGTTQNGGTMQAINGRLYPPLQYVSVVDAGSAAFKGGLRANDRILEVNGNDARGAAHSLVVDWVIAGGSKLTLKVLSVDEAEALRLKRLEESMDDPEGKKTKPPVGSCVVTIGGHKDLSDGSGQSYTVFHVYVGGKYRCSRRYREFQDLNKKLKDRFRWYNFPPFPGKKLNGLRATTLSESEKTERQTKLSQYLSTVCAVEDIFKSEAITTFLQATDRPDGVDEQEPQRRSSRVVAQPARVAPTVVIPPNAQGPTAPRTASVSSPPSAPPSAAAPGSAAEKRGAAMPVGATAAAAPAAAAGGEVTVAAALSDGRTVTVKVAGGTLVAAVEKALAKEAGLSRGAKLFGLFDVTQSLPIKFPGTAPASSLKGKLALRRWLFTKAQEAFVEDEVAECLLVHQIHEQMVAGLGELDEDTLARFAQLKEEKQWKKFLKAARKLDAYAAVQFPKCKSDFPEEDTQVVVTISLEKLALNAGGKEGETEFAWDVIRRHQHKYFLTIGYVADDDKEETITIDSPYGAYMDLCISRVLEERAWAQQLEEDESARDTGNWFVQK